MLSLWQILLNFILKNRIMKKFASMAVALLLVCFMVSCGPATPSDIAADSIEYIQAGDYESYVNTFDMSAEDKAQYREMFEKKATESLEESGGIQSYEIVSETISEDGTEATVEAVITYGNGETDNASFKFRKVGEEWKQVVNK